MSRSTLPLDERLLDYLRRHSVREHPLLARLREETAELPGAAMQIAPEQGQFLGWLIRLMGVRRALEVGVYTGYSSLVTALSLPPDGELIACDVNAETTAIARRYWAEAGVAERVRLELAPASETLAGLVDAGATGTFDFMFVDADKSGYRRYYELGLKLVRQGGVIAFDNTLWGGSVVDPEVQDEDTRALRELNAALVEDPRVDLVMVPIGDGLTLATVR